MRPPDWQEHPEDTATIANNVALLDAKIASEKGKREPFTLDLSKTWHVAIHRDCRHVPSPIYVGNFRGIDHPHLTDYDVEFGVFRGTPAELVGASLNNFVTSLNSELTRLDSAMPDPGPMPLNLS